MYAKGWSFAHHQLVGEREKEREWDFSEKKKNMIFQWYLYSISLASHSLKPCEPVRGRLRAEAFSLCLWRACMTCAGGNQSADPTLRFRRFRLTLTHRSTILEMAKTIISHSLIHDGVGHSEEKADTVFAFQLWRSLGLERLETSEF